MALKVFVAAGVNELRMRTSLISSTAGAREMRFVKKVMDFMCAIPSVPMRIINVQQAVA